MGMMRKWNGEYHRCKRDCRYSYFRRREAFFLFFVRQIFLPRISTTEFFSFIKFRQMLTNPNLFLLFHFISQSVRSIYLKVMYIQVYIKVDDCGMIEGSFDDDSTL